MIRFLMLALCAAMTLASPAWAQGYICTALQDEAAYQGKDSYKFLIDGNDGWVFRTKTDFKDRFQLKDEARQRLRTLNAVLLEKNVRLLLAPLPTRGMMHGNHINRQEYDRSLAIQAYRDLVSALENEGLWVAVTDNFDHQPAYYYQYDHHWRPDGARDMAEKIASVIKAKKMQFPAVDFRTETQGKVDHKGTFAKLIEKVCASSVPVERVDSYATYFADGDVLGERPLPDIVLVGTSNSVSTVSHANFDGFLKQALAADIENMSVSGGGADTALLEFLQSERMHAGHLPRLVIWEFPVYQGFAALPFLDQAITAVQAID